MDELILIYNGYPLAHCEINNTVFITIPIYLMEIMSSEDIKNLVNRVKEIYNNAENIMFLPKSNDNKIIIKFVDKLREAEDKPKGDGVYENNQY